MREMLRELLFHEQQGYGRWTRGMKLRVSKLIQDDEINNPGEKDNE